MSRGQVLSIFRQLRRTIKKTFSGDNTAITLANKELKSQFTTNKHLTSYREIQNKLAEAVEANEFIGHNVVQATKSTCGQYELSPEQAQSLREQTKQK